MIFGGIADEKSKLAKISSNFETEKFSVIGSTICFLICPKYTSEI